MQFPLKGRRCLCVMQLARSERGSEGSMMSVTLVYDFRVGTLTSSLAFGCLHPPAKWLSSLQTQPELLAAYCSMQNNGEHRRWAHGPQSLLHAVFLVSIREAQFTVASILKVCLQIALHELKLILSFSLSILELNSLDRVVFVRVTNSWGYLRVTAHYYLWKWWLENPNNLK